jgi:MOSC domain-containing protein YiiM
MVGASRDLVEGEQSAIWKEQVTGAIQLGELGLEGDEHAYHGHGGPEKALLHYAGEHYRMWAERFPAVRQSAGIPTSTEQPRSPMRTLFGENIHTFGMTEGTVCLGDRYRIGEQVVVEVTQPRQPCWKLGFSAGAPQIPALMQETAATGWYYRVVAPGPVSVGNAIVLQSRPLPSWTLSRMILGLYGTPMDREFLEELSGLSQLSAEWRTLVEARLSSGKVEDWNGRLYR